MNLIQNLFDTFFSSPIDSGVPSTEEKKAPENKTGIPPHTKVPFTKELEVLVERYGRFTELELNLQELLSVLPRRRARVDSYNRLVGWLAKQNIELRIKSRKNKKFV